MSSSPELIPFRAEHLAEFRHREMVDMEALIKSAVRVEGKGPAFTGVYQGRIIGCGGIVPMWPGVAEGWTVLSDEIPAFRIWFHRTVRLVIRDAMSWLNLNRLQIAVRSDSQRNVAWALSLGFENEGLMRRFGTDGGDYFRFALIGGE